MTRAAILFVGHVRDFYLYYDNYVERVLKPLQIKFDIVDVYASIWSQSTTTDSHFVINKSFEHGAMSEFVNVQEIIRLYKPTKIEIDDYNKHRHLFNVQPLVEKYNWDLTKFMIGDVVDSMFPNFGNMYKMSKVFKLMESAEKEGGFMYDFVLKYRFDMGMSENVPLDINFDNNTLVCRVSSRCNMPYAIDDMIMYGGHLAMSNIMTIYDNYETLNNINFENFPYNSREEGFLIQRVLLRCAIYNGMTIFDPFIAGEFKFKYNPKNLEVVFIEKGGISQILSYRPQHWAEKMSLLNDVLKEEREYRLKNPIIGKSEQNGRVGMFAAVRPEIRVER